MAVTKPTLVILAAGMGSRYGGLKQIDGVGPSEEGIIEYSIYDAIRAGFGKVVFVIRKDIEAPFREKFDGKFKDQIEVAYAFQGMDSFVPDDVDHEKREKPWGTSHAMLVAKDVVNEPFAVINADDYYGVEAFQKMASFLVAEADPETFAMVGYVLHRTLSDHGTVNRGVTVVAEDYLLRDVNERLKIQRGTDDKVTYLGEDGHRYELADDSVVSMNFWGFHPSIFDRLESGFTEFARENKDNPRAEYLIPELIDGMIKDGSAKVKVLVSEDKWYGVTYQEDKPKVQEAFSMLVAENTYPTPLFS
ncbi:dTDP-glucose pyrophosphorylase [Lewinella marina]|uniref:Nucleotidyltransferase n=1 Tax=Neolewinella marina TaxID=438751 RepID=A0A2G0CD16_9BACT|nr:sugar phosphate nucleotidyltransferase [Neolewinella marina]NJB86952.1 dTDP-glucose pyrophosphorylase [Neolewinella marina]PHK97852.1 nucleotidyltransferase [Neolewinella marina]